MKSELTLIVSGNYTQAREYAEAHNLQLRQWRFVQDREQIMGVENPKVVYCGTWQTRDDLAEIAELLRTRMR